MATTAMNKAASVSSNPIDRRPLVAIPNAPEATSQNSRVTMLAQACGRTGPPAFQYNAGPKNTNCGQTTAID